MEPGDILGVLLFFGGFMTIVAGLNLVFRWTSRRFPSETKVSDALEQVEHRLAELEERLDSAEQMLADVRRQLPPPGP